MHNWFWPQIGVPLQWKREQEKKISKLNTVFVHRPNTAFISDRLAFASRGWNMSFPCKKSALSSLLIVINPHSFFTPIFVQMTSQTEFRRAPINRLLSWRPHSGKHFSPMMSYVGKTAHSTDARMCWLVKWWQTQWSMMFHMSLPSTTTRPLKSRSLPILLLITCIISPNGHFNW